MKRLWVILILLRALSCLAAPFELELISETVEARNSTFTNTVRIYKVKGRDLHVRVEVLTAATLQTYETRVYHPSNPGQRLAGSLSYVHFADGKPTLTFIQSYSKSVPEVEANLPKHKGLGALVLQPVLSVPNVPVVRAVLAHSNYKRMEEALLDQGKEINEANFNEVVMDASHLGGILKELGYRADESLTEYNPQRYEIRYDFVPALVYPTSCQQVFPRLSDEASPRNRKLVRESVGVSH